MSALPMIQTMTGKENRKISFVEVNAFWCPPGAEEIPLFVAARQQADRVRKAGPPAFYPAIRNYPQDIGGSWAEQGYLLDEETLIKVWVRRKADYLAVQETAAVFLRVRSHAALTQAFIPLLGGHDSNRAEALFSGRFDVLNLRQAVTAGARINPAYAATMTDVQVRRLFRFVEQAPALIPPRPAAPVQTMRTESGQITTFRDDDHRDLIL